MINSNTSVDSDADQDDLLRHFFAEFLDTSEFEDFRRVEKLLSSLHESGITKSGHPLIRPRDCNAITRELAGIFQKAKPQFRIGDRRITDRFEQIICDFTKFCSSVYPSEASASLTLHAQVLQFLGQNDRVLEVVGDWVAKPYALENTEHILALAEVYSQALLRLGQLDRSTISFIALGEWLAANSRTHKPTKLGSRLAPFVALGSKPERTLRAKTMKFASKRLIRAGRTYGSAYRKIATFLERHFWGCVLSICYAWASKSARFRSPYDTTMNRKGGTLVTRAMGGIGDLLMMEPGLEALAAKERKPVDFAIPKKFFPIFKGNPHVRLIDIHGDAIDISSYRFFVNLSNCPASRYESKARPFIRSGRVEIFAREMGVSRRDLRRQGWHINQFQHDHDAEEFGQRFLKSNEFGRRPLVGVQPFSRDSYKDYPEIGSVILALSKDYDVLVFHHAEAGLPTGPGVASVAGLSLEQSLGLLRYLDAMVAVDSAFLHAAAAYDYPVIGLFGPTDARPLTRHHRRPVVLWKRNQFPCVPCWRNEDTPCALTELRSAKVRFDGTLGRGERPEGLVSSNSISPCIAAIAPTEVVAAVASALEVRSQ